jgi:hypothetical protein
MFRLSDAQRAAQARTFELAQADATLAAERARMLDALADCPGTTRQPLTLSEGNRARDAVRVRAQGDAPRLVSVAQVALADWRLRRARATGDAAMCEAARTALEAPPPTGAPDGAIERLGQATVARDPNGPGEPLADAEPLVAVSLYASGWADSVTADAPLPQYLAAVYGGVLLPPLPRPDLGDRSPAQLVDELAPAYPTWEPDALYAALAER